MDNEKYERKFLRIKHKLTSLDNVQVYKKHIVIGEDIFEFEEEIDYTCFSDFLILYFEELNVFYRLMGDMGFYSFEKNEYTDILVQLKNKLLNDMPPSYDTINIT